MLRLVLLAIVLLSLSLVVVVWWGTPRLLEVSPAAGAVDAPAGSSVQLTFSRPMLAESVTERLSLEPAIPGSYSWEGNRLVFTPEEPWPPGATVQVKLRSGAQAGGFPALPLLEGYEAAFTIRQPRLAFLYPASGPANIFTHNPQSGAIDPLTNSISGVLDFDVSPDGEAIYYSARNEQGGSDIFRLSLSIAGEVGPGTPTPVFAQAETILACPEAQCSGVKVSADGEHLAFERTGLPAAGGTGLVQVWILPLVNPAQLSRAGDPGHQTLQPAWSADGRLAFYDTQEAAFIVVEPGPDGQTREVARFANQTGQPGDWQPDGVAFAAAEIYFLTPGASEALLNLERLADSHLLLYPLDGGLALDLTELEGIEDAAPAFSPDGERLAFARKFLNVRQWSPGRQLWLRGLGDGEERQLTNDPLYNHYDFAWSPAGERLAFVRFNQSTLNEPPEVWTIDPLTGQATQIILGGYAPVWVP
jgi:Tol biopolymer transport system component